jgi:hypothetical protein
MYMLFSERELSRERRNQSMAKLVLSSSSSSSDMSVFSRFIKFIAIAALYKSTGKENIDPCLNGYIHRASPTLLCSLRYIYCARLLGLFLDEHTRSVNIVI